MLKGKDIILISNQMMDDRYWTSKQYITMELIKKNRVLYVEANYSFGKLISGLLGKKWPVSPFGRMQIKNENLTIMTPFPRLPYRNHFRWIGWLNQKLLLYKIRKATKHLNFDKPILWSILHQTADLIGKLGEEISVYHCVDDWPILLPLAGMGISSVIQKDEQKLLSSVDVTFRVSPRLLNYADISEKHITDISNGVDTTLFDMDTYSDKALPIDLKNLPRPIIGFSGSLGKWIDIELILRTAEYFKNASIVVIGLNEKNPNVQQLSSMSNIYFLGMKQRKEVPLYVTNFDVCLMPFKRSIIGEGLIPLKMFEYLALGKPVVSISSDALNPFKNILFLADNEKEFITLVERAIIEWNPNKSAFARELALEYSWENRVKKYSSEINKEISKTNDGK